MAVAHKSALSARVLYVPVGLFKTTRDISVSFNQLCKGTNERIRYKKFCASCNKEVTNDEIVKGYEFEKGRYVTITEDELEKIKTKKDKTIHIEYFTKMASIDPIYYEKNYYVVPEVGAEKAFELMRQAMLSEKMVGIAKTVIGTKEQLIVLYPTKETIIAKTLFYQQEIQELPKSQVKVQVGKEELDMAKALIKSMTKDFDISAFHDEYQERLKEAIEKKIKGQEIVNVDKFAPNNIIDLQEMLTKSLEMSDDKKGTA